MTCSNCKNPIPSDSVFCPFCGEAVLAPPTAVPPPVIYPPVIYPPAKKQRVKKKRFCKKCGSPVNHTTRKCTGCGKQYFRFSKVLAAMILLSVLLLGASGAAVYQTITLQRQIQNKNKLIDILNSNLETNRQLILEYQADKRKYTADKQKYMDQLWFMDAYIVIVPTGSHTYHKYGCEKLNDKSFRAYNIDAAKAMGYTPCPVCCK